MENLPAGKAVVTGTPIRQELFAGDAVKAMTFCGFTEVLPTLLVIGGSSGSVRVNEAIRSCLPELTKKYNVIHLCGKGNIDESYNGTAHYVQFDYIKQELAEWRSDLLQSDPDSGDLFFSLFYTGVLEKRSFIFSIPSITRRFRNNIIIAKYPIAPIETVNAIVRRSEY